MNVLRKLKAMHDLDGWKRHIKSVRIIELEWRKVRDKLKLTSTLNVSDLK